MLKSNIAPRPKIPPVSPLSTPEGLCLYLQVSSSCSPVSYFLSQALPVSLSMHAQLLRHTRLCDSAGRQQPPNITIIGIFRTKCWSGLVLFPPPGVFLARNKTPPSPRIAEAGFLRRCREAYISLDFACIYRHWTSDRYMTWILLLAMSNPACSKMCSDECDMIFYGWLGSCMVPASHIWKIINCHRIQRRVRCCRS